MVIDQFNLLTLKHELYILRTVIIKNYSEDLLSNIIPETTTYAFIAKLFLLNTAYKPNFNYLFLPN